MPKVLIPDKLLSGLLPTVRPLTMWAGLGNGRLCDGCGRSITPTDVEYELEFADKQTLRLHKDCFVIWHQATGS